MTFHARRSGRAVQHRVATAVLLALVMGVACGPAPREEAGDVAFVGVNVVPMTEPVVLENHTVVVDDGRIVAMGHADAIRVVGETEIVDGEGLFLMPGVAEMHGHYPQDAEGQFTRDVMFLYVANGVTLVRGMQGGPQHLPLRDAIVAGDMLAPRIWVSAPSMFGGNLANPNPAAVMTVEQARERVRAAHDAGFDHLKVHEGLSVEVFDALAATANELDIPFGGHVSNFVGLEAALAAGQQTIDHLDNYLEALIPDQEAVAQLGLFDLGRLAGQIDDSRIEQLVAATREAGAAVVPTMALWEILFGSRSGDDWLADRPETRYMPAAMVNGWKAATDQRVEQFGQDPQAIANILQLRRRVLKALSDGGVPILLGTDSPQIFSVPGFSVHHEMEVMIAAGMNRYEVLRSGTAAVAEFYGLEGEMGTVAEGLRADLVLLEANPLESVDAFARRAGVVIAGRWLSAEAIETELESIAGRATGSN